MILDSLYSAFLRELSAIIKNSSILSVVVGGTLLYAFFYPTPYLNDIVTKQNIAIVDNDNTSLSREFIFNVRSMQQINVYEITSMQKAKKLMLENKIYGILNIPKDFEKNTILSSLPEVQYIADASYFLIYGSIIEGLNNASNGLIPSIKSKQALYKNVNLSNKIPLKWDLIPLYNPTTGYMNYILPAILVFILYQTLLIACSIIGMGLEIHNPKQNLISTIILARILALLAIYIPLFLFYFGFVYDFFNLVNTIKIIDILYFGLIFIVSTSIFGIFIASLFSKASHSIELMTLLSLPILFSLGFIWPNELIPNWIRLIINLIPILPALDGFLKINQMGASLNLITPQIMHLVSLSIIYFSATCIVYRIKNLRIKN